MPHLTIQTTPNVIISHKESLLKTLNKVLWDSGHFGKPTDIKARMIPIDTFLIGIEDDEKRHGFIYANLKIMTGRHLDIRNQLAELLVATIEAELSEQQSRQSTLQICVEVEDGNGVYHKKMPSN